MQVINTGTTTAVLENSKISYDQLDALLKTRSMARVLNHSVQDLRPQELQPKQTGKGVSIKNSAEASAVAGSTVESQDHSVHLVVAQILFNDLRQSTQASEKDCLDVTHRLAQEVARICAESKRIQASGQIKYWATNLAQHRLEKCLKYYELGSHRGRKELHSVLSAIVYRYIAPKAKSSYQARLTLIEDFLQGFYVEALGAFRKENDLPDTHQPKTLLELAEYMAFTERYGKRKIPLPNGHRQQLIVLRVQTFSNQQPTETYMDLEQAAEGISDEADSWDMASVQQVREEMVAQTQDVPDDTLRREVVDGLMGYLKDRKQDDCIDYFALRLMDMSASEIETTLGLTTRERDYLQQRFKYHALRFALSHRWELVHQWLGIDLERNLGLTPQEWEILQGKMTQQQAMILEQKQDGVPDLMIARNVGCTISKLKKQWAGLLEEAWDIRNSIAAA